MLHACDWTVLIGQFKGKVKHHAYVSGQNASCALAVVLHLAEVTDVVFFFFFMNTYNRCLVRSQILS